MSVKSGRLRIAKSKYDLQPDDEPTGLVDFEIRGRRGAILAQSTVDRRMALRYFRTLGEVLGEFAPSPTGESRDD